MDHTILIHQAATTQTPHDARVVLIGDSSCLMDVDALRLSQELNQRVLNLGTLSYLGLEDYARMLRRYSAVNPGQVRAVVLLLHPEFLRRNGPEAHHRQLLDEFYAGADHCDTHGFRGRSSCWLGLEIFRGRLLSRAIPTPLPDAFGKYGFTADLSRYLDEHNGSAVDPRTFDWAPRHGNAEYRLSLRLQNESATFKAALPTGVKLVVGITPAPESFILPGYPDRYAQMLRGWNEWMKADMAQLPPTMPDRLFASTTHLSESGRRAFTRILAHSIEPYLGSPGPETRGAP
jgi:hypothetical protein